MSKISTRDARTIATKIANREDFATHGALRGERVTGALTSWDMGRLPREFYTSAMFAGYVVYSYATPIAWLDIDGNWQVPDARYSVTTSKHQSTIRYAVSMTATVAA